MSEYSEYLPFLYFVIGVLARAVLPWLVRLKNEDTYVSWEWGFLRGQLVASVIVMIALPLLFPTFLAAVHTWDFFEAWTVGYTVADLGRVAEKLVYKKG